MPFNEKFLPRNLLFGNDRIFLDGNDCFDEQVGCTMVQVVFRFVKVVVENCHVIDACLVMKNPERVCVADAVLQ